MNQITKPEKLNNMKRYLLIITMLLGAVCSWGQDLSKDFVVIDNGCFNSLQLKTQYNGPNTVIVMPDPVIAPIQITKALKGKQVIDLHLFVPTKPGAMGFGNIALNSDNVLQYSAALSQWASHVSGKVVIHGSEVFTSTIGVEFKAQLEQITGLNFIAQ